MSPQALDRIAVIGCGGAGKTHVARLLGALLETPVTHLDGVYYDESWNPRNADEFARVQEELVREPRWIIEGNYASSLHIRLRRATTVLLIDLAPIVCLWGVLHRRLRYRGGQHAEHGVYDRINVGFVRYILSYRKSMRPRVEEIIRNNGEQCEVVVLRRRREVDRFVDSVRAVERASADE